MLVLAIILAVLILIALLRFGVTVKYGEDGLTVTARAGILSLRVYPKKEKRTPTKRKAERLAQKAKKKKEKKAEKKAEKKKKKKEQEKTSPGKLEMLKTLLPAIKNVLGRIRRRLLIKKLIFWYTAAGKDPMTTALTFGAANAAFEIISPILEKNFRVKHRDLRATADFNATEQKIYLNASISLSLWEAIYIVLALLPLLALRGKKTTEERGKRKEERGKRKE